METLANGYTLEICQGGFPLSTDSMCLAHFVKLPSEASVLDLGSGCGTLGLLLCARHEGIRVTGVELSEAAHACALENIRRNRLTRMESICADLRQWKAEASYDLCVSNPPYFSGGPAAALKDARREDQCSLQALFDAAAKAVKFGGDLFLVHRPERLAELCSCACAAKLEPKRLALVRHQADAPVALVMLQCRKGGKPGLVLEDWILRHCDGSPTDLYRAIYHL
jgi:tRNA1(Val) A37 N6-methylase TrmN6